MTYLGTLTATGGSKGVNNATTGVPFAIPASVREIHVESDTPGVLFAVGGGDDTFAITSGNGMKLYDAYDADVSEGPFDVPYLPAGSVRVAIYDSTGAANVMVFAGKLS